MLHSTEGGKVIEELATQQLYHERDGGDQVTSQSLREAHRALVLAFEGLRGREGCWCPKAQQGHSAACWTAKAWVGELGR